MGHANIIVKVHLNNLRMNSKNTFSIKTKVLKTLIVGFMIMIVILLYDMIYINAKLRCEVKKQCEEILSMQVASLDDKLLQNETTILTWNMANIDIKKLRLCNDKNTAEQLVSHIRSLFSNNISNGNFMEFNFVISDIQRKRVSGMSLNGSFSATEKASLDRYVLNLDLEQCDTDYQWKPVKIGEEWFYFYIICKDNVCLGQAISVRSLIKSLGMQDGKDKLVTIYAGQTVLSGNDWIEERRIIVDEMEHKQNLDSSIRNNYLVVRNTSSRLAGSVYFLQDNIFTEGFSGIITIFYISTSVIFLIYLIVFGSTYGNMRRPIEVLKNAMGSVKKGEMETQIKTEGKMPIEFMDAFQLFNEMVAKIKSLKIAFYESELKKNAYEIQYLSIQIEPHFYLNAMKGIYALAQHKKYQSIQDMILNLSNCFRYLTYDKSNKLNLVKLKEELIYVESYLSVVKSGNRRKIITELNLDQRANEVLLPKLLVQTFVENSVKYALMDNQDLVINMEISIFEESNEAYLSLVITDNGQGFSTEFLGQIKKNGFVNNNKHVGLTNLYHRLQLLYGDKAYMGISNKEDTGACAKVIIPIKS